MPPPKAPPPDPFEQAPMSPSLRALARRGVLLPRRRGTQLINEGDVGDTIFIVLAGKLRAYSGNIDREVTYAEYGPGEYVGELGLDGGPRSASVEAVEDTLCAMVTRQTLQQHLDADPPFAFEMLLKVIRSARLATFLFKQIALNDVYVRLRGRLLELAVQQPDGTCVIDPAPSQLELSQQVGCVKPMVNKLLGELKEGGYVEVGRRRIVILRPLPLRH